MKIRRILFVSIILLVSCTQPQNLTKITASWNANEEIDLAGYYVYVESDTGLLRVTIVGTDTTRPETTKTFLLDTGKKYSFHATAVDSAGNESAPSDTVKINFGDRHERRE